MTTPPEIDDHELEALEREAPVLVRVRRFSSSLSTIPWFSHLGERPSQEVRDAADLYVNALGFPDAALAVAPTWEDAAEAAETLDWASPAWESEELARSDLTGAALMGMSEPAFDVAMRLVAQEAGDAARESMEQYAALWDMEDESSRQLAVGSVAQACHGAALLLMASASDPELEVHTHAFSAKLRLFVEGRWPIALVGSTFTVF